MTTINYHNATISLRTEQFGNGTAVEISVNDEKILDLYDSAALFTTEREALQRGEQMAKAHVDRQVPVDDRLDKRSERFNQSPPGPTQHGLDTGMGQNDIDEEEGTERSTRV